MYRQLNKVIKLAMSQLAIRLRVGAGFCAVQPWKLFTFGQFSLPAYARCTGTDSELELASDIRQPITQRAHVYHTNACQ